MPLLVLNVTATSTPFRDTQTSRQVMMKNGESPGQFTQQKVTVYVGWGLTRLTYISSLVRSDTNLLKAPFSTDVLP